LWVEVVLSLAGEYSKRVAICKSLKRYLIEMEDAHEDSEISEIPSSVCADLAPRPVREGLSGA
jgi:hypothetical protein